MIWLLVIIAACGVGVVVVHVTADEQVTDQLVRVDDPPATGTAPAQPTSAPVPEPARAAAADDDDFLAVVDGLRAAAVRDTRSCDMEELLADRASCRRALTLISGYPPLPTVREVEDLLLDEHKRLETEIARRQLAGLAHPRYLDQKAS